MTQAIYVQAGGAVDYTPVSAVVAGQVIVLDGRIAIATRPIAAAALGALATTGIFKMVKKNEEIAGGAAVYWDADGDPYGGDAGTGAITASAGGNTFAGYTGTVTAGATDATVDVALQGPNGASITIHESLSAVIADPGDGGAIPVATSGTCSITTTGVDDTRTLAIPTFLGQQISLGLAVDAGDAVITAASAINQAGNNTLTAADAGDNIVLVAIYKAAALVWRVACNDGVAMSTV